MHPQRRPLLAKSSNGLLDGDHRLPSMLRILLGATSRAGKHWWIPALITLSLSCILVFRHPAIGGRSAWQQDSMRISIRSTNALRSLALHATSEAGQLQPRLDSPRGPSRATALEVAALLANVAEDLAPWRETGIELEGIERAYCSFGGYEREGFRLQVMNGTGYVVGDLGGFQTRARTLRQQILDVIQLYDVPDVDMFFSVSDACKPADVEWRSHDGDLERCRPFLGPVISFDKLDGEDHCVLAPDWTFGGWPEAFTPDWDRARAIMLDAQVPWEEKDVVMFWRGGRTSQERDVLINDALGKNESFYNVAFIDWEAVDRGDIAASGFVAFSDHCRHRYLLHMAGVTYSTRLKYLLLCNSLVLFPLDGHREFWFHMLEDGGNIVYTENAVGDNRGRPLLAALVEHMHDDERAHQIAARGFHLVSEVLHPHNIHRYWLELFTQYAKLQQFEVQLHADAIPLLRAQTAPYNLTRASDRTCNVC